MSAGVELIPLAIMILMRAKEGIRKGMNNEQKTLILSTGFSQQEQLSEALEDAGYQITVEDETIFARSSDFPAIKFHKEGETYQAVFHDLDEKQCLDLLKKITGMYQQSCQKETYRKIVDTIDKKGFHIKQEEFLPDQTIRLRVSAN